MSMRLSAAVAACVALSAVALGQDAPAPPTPAPAATEATPLPPVVVETSQEAPKAKVKAKKKSASKGPAVATQQATPPPPVNPTGPGNANASDKTASGPVKDYSAKNTATGMKTDTPLNEIPQSVSVVGAEQIRDQGAHTMQEALRYVPGVVADAYGFDGRTDSTFIRGTEAAEFLDGLRRTFSYYTYNYRMDPYFLERVEVLKGPASVLYGQAPVGGILNAVSKRPQSEQGGEVTVEYGTFDFKQVKFDMTGPVSSDGKWSYRLTGAARDAGTQVDFVDDDRFALQPAITYRPDSNTTVTVLGHFQRDATGTAAQFFPHIGTIFPNASGRYIAQNRFGGEPDDHYDTDVDSGTLLVEHKFAPWLKLQHSSRFADIRNDYLGTYPLGYTDPGVEENIARYRYKALTNTQTFNQDTNLEAKFSTGALTHRVLGGVDYSHFKASTGSNFALDYSDFNVYAPQYNQHHWQGTGCDGTVYDGVVTSYDNPQVCSMSDQTVEQTGVYAQDQMRLGNWLAVVGTRKDWIENAADGSETQKDSAISYRAGLMYEFATGLTPYVSYGESFVPVVSPTFSGVPLQPQQGSMYEVGFKYQPVGANFAINGAVYDIAENNRLAVDPLHPNFYVQTGAVAIKGFEIEATGRVSQNLKIVGGYSYTQAEYDDGSVIDGNQIESVPEHLASLWGVWEFDQPYLRGWSVGAGARYIGASLDETNTLRVPAVTLFDAMVAYEEEHWRWQLSATNLEDKEYVTTCLARGDCFLGTARTVITGLTYKY
jgi:iron complex outermembrane recepter protein